MKRICAILLAFTLIFVLAVPAFAAENSAEGEAVFDSSVFESSGLYKYDKFEKTWHITGWYEHDYNDGSYVLVGSLLYSDYVDYGWGPEFRVVSYDGERDEYEKVNGFYALVDDTLYSFPALFDGNTNGYVFGGNVAREFLKSLSTAKEVAFKFDVTSGKGNTYSFSIDNVDTEKLDELIEISKLFEKSNAWNIDENPEASDGLVKASIS